MAVIPKPATQREMIDQIWFVLIGSNGDGVVTKVRAISKDIDDIKSKLPTLLPREEHDEEEEKKDRGRRENSDRRKMSRREVISLTIAGISTLAAIGAVIVAILALVGGIA